MISRKPLYINQGAGNRVPQPKVRILEQTRLSRLPRLSASPVRTVQLKCVICGAGLEAGTFQGAIKVCKKCLGVYSQVDSAINARSEEKSRQAKLEQFARKIGGTR